MDTAARRLAPEESSPAPAAAAVPPNPFNARLAGFADHRAQRDLAAAARLASPHAAEPTAQRRDRARPPAPADEPTAAPRAPAAAQHDPAAAQAAAAQATQPATATAPAAPARDLTPAAPPRPPEPAPEAHAGAGLLGHGAAHVRLESETLGDVALHLRLRDGNATVRIEADDPSALEQRAPELARALAAEGLSLTRVDFERRDAPVQPPAPDQGGRDAGSEPGGRQRGQDATARDDAPPPPPRPAPRPTPSRTARRSGHDVTA
ncbi:MAG: flagellar hook-length control protein FliK [Anaeromyxobacteraceae bacterium]